MGSEATAIESYDGGIDQRGETRGVAGFRVSRPSRQFFRTGMVGQIAAQANSADIANAALYHPSFPNGPGRALRGSFVALFSAKMWEAGG